MSGKDDIYLGRLKPHIYTTFEYLLGEEERAQENAWKPQSHQKDCR